MGSMDASGRALRGASRTGLLRARISSWTRLEARYGLPGSIRTGRRDRASGVAGGCGEESKMLIVAHRGNAPRIRSLVARGNRHIDFGNYARNLTDTTSALLFNYPTRTLHPVVQNVHNAIQQRALLQHVVLLVKEEISREDVDRCSDQSSCPRLASRTHARVNRLHVLRFLPPYARIRGTGTGSPR